MFRLRQSARAWFSNIRNPTGLKLDFDIYYLCLMAGLAARRKAPELPASEVGDMVDDFPLPYRSRSRLIIALFLQREMEFHFGSETSDREAVHELVAGYLAPNSPGSLSEEGFKGLNCYSYSGYDVLSQDWFEGKPYSIEAFLPLYLRKLNEKLRGAGLEG